MKKLFVNILLAGLLIVSFGACKKCEDHTGKFREGIYIGTYNRSSPDGRFQQSLVKLNLENNNFSGASSIGGYPEICKGSFTVTTSTMEFREECVRQAMAPVGFVLDGSFKTSINGKDLILIQDQGAGIYDTYRLVRQ